MDQKQTWDGPENIEVSLVRAGPVDQPGPMPLWLPVWFAERFGGAMLQLGAIIEGSDGGPYQPPEKGEAELAAQVAAMNRATVNGGDGHPLFANRRFVVAPFKLKVTQLGTPI